MCARQREGQGKGEQAEGAVPTTDEQDTPSGCTQSGGWCRVNNVPIAQLRDLRP